MVQEYPGFLTERLREYVKGERDIQEDSNPSREKARLRDRILGAKRDMALLQSSDQQWVQDQLIKADRNVHDPRGLDAPMTDEAVEGTQGLVEAQAQSLGLETDGIEQTLEEMEREIENIEIAVKNTQDGFRDEEAKEFIKERYADLFALGCIKSVDAMIEGWAGDVDTEEVVTALVEEVWPSQEKMMDKVEDQLKTE